MKWSRAIGLLAGMVVLGGTAAQAADMPEREFGLLFGGGWADSDLVGGKDDEVNPLFGLRYGQQLDDSFNLFGDLVYGPYDGDRAGVGDANITTLRGGVEWLFSKQQRYNWFLSGGLGLMNVGTDRGPDFTRPMASLGVGQAWQAGSNDAFRWEVRADQSFGNSSLPNAGLTNIQALIGYAWGVGAPADVDRDGVPNRLDQCPDTPQGVKVDPKGCPLDSDRDGVFDGLDRCPDTPAGARVNADGCPLDSDRDGVADHRDRCPDTPAGARVNADGCPLDGDGDGIADHMDKCPTVPAPGTADGCPPRAAEVMPAKLVLQGVNFDDNSANLRRESFAILDNAVATLRQWGQVRVEIAGHTDSVSSEAHNLALSQRRAETVRAYLIERGIAADRLIARGYGEAQPVADNATAEGRFKNRRVEFVPLP